MPPRPPQDRPGPHPENQRKRSELRGPRVALIGLLTAAALLAVAVGAAITAGQLRNVLAFTSGRSSGALLVLLIGAPQAIAAVLLAIHHVHARAIALLAALLAVGWSMLHMMLIDTTWAALVLFGIGALEVFLVAACSPRETAGAKKRQRRR